MSRTQLARRTPRAGLVAALVVLAGTGLAPTACGTPPELRPGPGSSVPPPPSEVDSSAPAPIPTDLLPTDGADGTASPEPTFAEEYPVSCAGHPTAAQVSATVRRDGGPLPRSGVAVTVGPLCAGTWQYTVYTVGGREPLHVVTRGAPGHLKLVTAGTDVCNIPVRTGAPAGILTAAQCPPPGG